jgi:hypothetical protein
MRPAIVAAAVKNTGRNLIVPDLSLSSLLSPCFEALSNQTG